MFTLRGSCSLVIVGLLAGCSASRPPPVASADLPGVWGWHSPPSPVPIIPEDAARSSSTFEFDAAGTYRLVEEHWRAMHGLVSRSVEIGGYRVAGGCLVLEVWQAHADPIFILALRPREPVPPAPPTTRILPMVGDARTITLNLAGHARTYARQPTAATRLWMSREVEALDRETAAVREALSAWRRKHGKWPVGDPLSAEQLLELWSHRGDFDSTVWPAVAVREHKWSDFTVDVRLTRRRMTVKDGKAVTIDRPVNLMLNERGDWCCVVPRARVMPKPPKTLKSYEGGSIHRLPEMQHAWESAQVYPGTRRCVYTCLNDSAEMIRIETTDGIIGSIEISPIYFIDPPDPDEP